MYGRVILPSLKLFMGVTMKKEKETLQEKAEFGLFSFIMEAAPMPVIIITLILTVGIGGKRKYMKKHKKH